MAAEETDTAGASRRRRIIGMGVWTAAFVVGWLVIGLPTDPIYAFGWLWAATIAWNNARPWRHHLGFVRDWLPIVSLLVIYNLSRGYAGKGVPHVYELVRADTWMFGWATGGLTPTVWLQRELYDPAVIHWWDILGSWVYFSHFAAALVVAVVLWLRSRELWARFIRRWFFLSFIGLITYFAYPAAPPWWAGKYGVVDEVARISTRGWQAMGLHGAGNMLNAAQVNVANPVAAMPSLHTAFALLVVAFFFTRVRKRWIPVLVLYPLAMTFTLVYSGEHWIIDVLVGWLYVGVTFAVCALAERWWARRRARRATEAREPVPVP
ncbi:phosphatase PAP2 family protein [Longispora sp. K20-0274]|uniref:phosphatase PAP2 family protein n=1 Tax=Longispora sp. K20-0274 TaxID=3088255 RepID=UPI00399AD9AD